MESLDILSFESNAHESWPVKIGSNTLPHNLKKLRYNDYICGSSFQNIIEVLPNGLTELTLNTLYTHFWRESMMYLPSELKKLSFIHAQSYDIDETTFGRIINLNFGHNGVPFHSKMGIKRELWPL